VPRENGDFMKAMNIIVLTVLLCVTSCTQRETQTPNFVIEPGVYIIGYDETDAIYWKNGE